MREQIMNLIIRIDKMKSTTEIKEELGKLIIDYDNNLLNDVKIDIDVEGRNCCMPSACISNCCDKPIVDVNTNITLPETDPKKCCFIM